jgi:ribosomal protein L16 Arg81 hydroxylase
MGWLSNLFEKDNIINTLEEEVRSYRELNQQYQEDLKKALAERDEALKYKELNIKLKEELRIKNERIASLSLSLESLTWKSQYFDEFFKNRELTKQISKLKRTLNKISNKKTK